MKASLFLNALSGKNKSSKVPLWLMRQAGRYLKEYRALRERYDFLTLCKNPELIVQVTKMPIDIFGFDAAIVFSDILLIAQNIGFDVRFEEGSGPHLNPPLDGPQDLKRLVGHNAAQPDLLDAISLLKRELKVPLLGFAGAPFTLASYLIEGKSTPHFKKTKKWMLEDPASFHTLLDLLAGYTIDHLNAQIKAGVDAVQIFDTWADKVAWPQFQEFSLKYMQKVMQGLLPCPVILFCRGAHAQKLGSIQPAAISLDWQSDLATVRKETSITLQGNLDPDVLLTNPLTVVREATKILHSMKNDPAFIFNLGHGIHPETPRENVEALVSCLRN